MMFGSKEKEELFSDKAWKFFGEKPWDDPYMQLHDESITTKRFVTTETK